MKYFSCQLARLKEVKFINYQCQVTQNGATLHGVRAFFDWNKDGDFVDGGGIL